MPTTLKTTKDGFRTAKNYTNAGRPLSNTPLEPLNVSGGSITLSPKSISNVITSYSIHYTKLYEKIPVVVVTAVTGFGGDPEPFKKFISTRKQVPPPEAFFSKPIDKESFVDAVKRILA